jgi:hypothetical protein
MDKVETHCCQPKSKTVKETKSKPIIANPKSKKEANSKPNKNIIKCGYQSDPLLPTPNPEQNKTNIKTQISEIDYV